MDRKRARRCVRHGVGRVLSLRGGIVVHTTTRPAIPEWLSRVKELHGDLAIIKYSSQDKFDCERPSHL